MKTKTRPQIGGPIAALTLLSLTALPTPVWALGIRLPDQDAVATARGNAFVATADDPAAVYYNPAGITQLDGANASLGLYAISYADRYDSAFASANSQQEWAALPQSFGTFSLPKYNLALGFGLYSPYGLSMEWPTKVPWAPAGYSGEIDYVRANPVLAWQVAPSLSIAAGLMLDYSQAELITSPSLAGPGLKLRGRDTDFGFNVGVLWRPAPEHAFGITYRSATDMDYDGHISFNGAPLASQAARLNYHLPQTVTAGYSFRPSSSWNLEADVDWTDWSSLRTAGIQTGPAPIPGIVFNWKPSIMWEFGASYYFSHNWQASAGFMYSENSIPDSSFNALIPDSDRYLFSLGVGQKYHHLSWNAAYQLGLGPTRLVSGDTQAAGAYNGDYEFFSNAVSVDVGYHF